SFQERKGLGGLVSVGVVVTLCILLIGELREYLSPAIRHDFLVDPTVDHMFQLNVDMTIKMPCSSLSMDVMDVTGDTIHVQDQLRMETRPFTTEGAIHFRDLSGYTYNEDVHNLLRQGQQVRKAPSTPGSGNGDGCRVYGSMDVAKIHGNFHVTAKGHGHGGEHVAHDSINFSHRIDKFSFGPDHPGIHNPLDNSVEVSKVTFERYKYTLSVVPTIFTDAYSVLLTTQYAVSEHDKEVPLKGGQPMQPPGIFFSYTIEPITIRVSEDSVPLFMFLLRSCSIIGGIWVTAGLLYR
ncbi:endoplasmic reticulum vesicle transporter-domain-containing protein, partial [Piptocephalis cylindrospora]